MKVSLDGDGVDQGDVVLREKTIEFAAHRSESRRLNLYELSTSTNVNHKAFKRNLKFVARLR